MNYVGEYREVTLQDGRKGIFCELQNENLGAISIMVGENEQIAMRIMFLVKSGLCLNESLEDDLPFTDDLFNKQDYEIIYDLIFSDEEIYLHKKFK